MGIVRPIRHNFHIKVPSHRVRPAQRLRNGWPKTWVGGGLGGEEGRWGGGGGDGRAPTTGRSGPENVRSPSRAPWADERRRIWCGWATGPPQPDVVGASSTSSQQPAAAASSTGLRDTREGGERGARGGSSAGGQPEGGTVPLWKAARLPRNHGVGAVVLAAARGRAAAAARALGGGSGSATRSCVATEGAQRLSRPLACLARAAAPPGGVADLGGCPKQRGSRGQMHDRRSQSKARLASIWGGSLWCL